MAENHPTSKSQAFREESEFLRLKALSVKYLIGILRSSGRNLKRKELVARATAHASTDLHQSADQAARIARKSVGVAFGVFSAMERGCKGEAPERIAKTAKERFARALRACPTDSEARLLHEIQRRFPQYRFRSNKVAIGFIPDIYSELLKLIIEVDGSSHVGREEYDARRDRAFAAKGIQTVRIPASMVMALKDLRSDEALRAFAF